MADDPTFRDLTRYSTPEQQHQARMAQYKGAKKPFQFSGNFILPGVAASAAGSFFDGLAGDLKTLNYIFEDDLTEGAEHSLRNVSSYINSIKSQRQQDASQKEFIRDDWSLGEAWGDIYSYVDLAGSGVGSIAALILGGGILKIAAKGGLKLMTKQAISKKADDLVKDAGGDLTHEAAMKQAKKQLTDYAEKYDSAIGTGAYGTAESAMVSGSVGHAIEEEVMRAPPEVLNQSDRFREIYFDLVDNNELTHDQAHNMARIQLSREAGIQGAKEVAIPSALLGAVAGRYIDKAISGRLTKSTLANFAILEGVEIPTEMGQGAVEQYTQNKVYKDLIDKTRNVMEGVPDAAVREGIGAAFGVAPLAGIRAKAETQLTQGNDPDFDTLSDLEQLAMANEAGKVDEDAAETALAIQDGKRKFAALNQIITSSVTGINTGEVDEESEVEPEAPTEVPDEDADTLPTETIDTTEVAQTEETETVAPDIGAALASLHPQAKGEYEYLLENMEEPDSTVALSDLIARADEDPRAFKRPALNSIRQAAIDLGIYREVSQEELDNIVTTRKGRKYDFMLGGKKYMFEQNIPQSTEPEVTLEPEPEVTLEPEVDGAEIEAAANEAATSPTNDLPEPTKAQKEAGNYKKGHVNIDGLDISIENPAGSKRREEWPELKHHYGDIKRTSGADGDSVDVFINKDGGSSQSVFIVNQTDEKGKFDEHKVMLGFSSEEEARQGYLDNYEEGWEAPADIPELTMEEFKEWLAEGNPDTPYYPGPARVKGNRILINGEKISKYDALSQIDDMTPATTYINKNERDYTSKEIMRFYNAMWRLKNEVRFSLSAPTPQAVHAVDVSIALNKLPPGLRKLTATVETEDDLPKRVQKTIMDRKLTGQVRGAFFKNRIYIVATNHPSVDAAVRTFLHESIGHYGLRKTLGNDADPFLDDVAKAYPKEIRAIARQYKLDPFTKAGRREAAEEYVAQMAENSLNPTLWERLVDLINKFIAKLGIAMPLTQVDIKRTLSQARQTVENDGFDVSETSEDEVVRFALKSNTAATGTRTANDTVVQAIKDGQPVDAVFRGIWGIAEATQLPKAVRASSAATLRATVNYYDQHMPWLHPTMQKLARGLIDRYGLDDDYKILQATTAAKKAQIINEVREIIDLLEGKGVTAEESKKIYEILTNESPREAAWDAITEPVRQRIEELGQQAVDLGLVSQAAYDRNKGAYLHRVYRKYEQNRTGLQKWADNISARKRKIVGQETMERGNSFFVKTERIRSDVRVDEFIDEDGKGATIYKIDKMSANGQRVIKTTYAREAPEEVEPGTKVQKFEVRAEHAGRVKLWRDWTKEEREDMGEITDARYVLGKTFALLAHDISTGEFFQQVADNPAWTWQEDGAPPDAMAGDEYDSRLGKYSVVTGAEWVKVPKTKIPKSQANKYGALAGKYVKAEVFQDINATIQAQNVTWWKDILTAFKLNKTARNPVVHFNNVMSNIVLMDMADVRFSDLGRALVEIAKKGDLYKEAEMHGAMGVSFAERELQQDVLNKLLDEMVDATGGKSLTLEDTILSLDKLPFNKQVAFMTKIIDKLWHGFDVKGRKVGLKAFDDKMLDFYRHEDEIFRLATYIRRRGQGLSKISAGIEARDQFLNYDIQAPWINALRASLLPFLSYTYRAIPIVAKSLAQRPWKLAKYFTIAYGMNAIGYALSGGDEERERKSLRDDVSGKLWIGSDRLIRMGWNDPEGNPYFWDVRRLVPVGDVFDMNQHNAALPIIPASLMPSGPIAMGFEFMLNKTSFFGEEIVDPLADDPATATEKTLDWLWKSYGPSAPWIPASYYWDKLGVAATGGRDRLGREYNVLEAVASSAGVKVARHDVKYGMMLKAMEIERSVQAIRFRLSQLEKDHWQGKVNESRYNQLRDRYTRSLENLEQKARELLAP